MKSIVVFCLVLFSHSLNAQSDITSTLKRGWLMDEVLQDGQDVSKEHNPKLNRYIVFYGDGSFESGGDPYGKNTGKYFVYQTNSRLVLDSDLGEEDDSMWQISFSEGKMKWVGIGSEWAEQFVLTYRRKILE